MIDEAGTTKKERNEGWHVDKRVSVSHLLATATLAVGLIQWGSAIELRMSQLETRIEVERQAQASIDSAQDTARASAVTAVAARLDRIEDKLDRLIEGDHRDRSRSRP